MPTPGASESGVNETSTPSGARTSADADRGSLRHRLRIRARHRRYVVRSNPKWHGMYRIAVGTIGTIVLLCGIVAVPYPGPAGSSCSSDWASWRPSSTGRTGC